MIFTKMIYLTIINPLLESKKFENLRPELKGNENAHTHIQEHEGLRPGGGIRFPFITDSKEH